MANFFAKPLNTEAPEVDRSALLNARLSAGDLDLLFRVGDAGNVRKQQSSTRAALVFNNHVIVSRIQIFQYRLLRRKQDVD